MPSLNQAWLPSIQDMSAWMSTTWSLHGVNLVPALALLQRMLGLLQRQGRIK